MRPMLEARALQTLSTRINRRRRRRQGVLLGPARRDRVDYRTFRLGKIDPAVDARLHSPADWGGIWRGFVAN